MSELVPNPPAVPPASPGDYLDHQAQAASRAFSRTLSELRATLMGEKDPAGAKSPGLGDLAKKHPYYTVGGAAFAGFLAAAIFVPSKEQQMLRKLAALERAVALQGQDPGHVKPGKGIAGSLLGSMTAVLKPALLQIVTAAMAARTVSEETPPEADGSEWAQGDGHPASNSAL